MKHRSFLFLFLCLLSGAVHAANVTGTVTDQNANPVSGQTIFVTDSNNNYSLTAITGASGTYSITLPATAGIGTQIMISTMACGAVATNYAIYSGANITSNFTNPCGSAPTSYVLQGNVTLSGVANNGVADVYLIQATYDAATSDWTLTAIDTIVTSSTGAFSATYSSYPGVSGSDLLLKAALRSNHPSYAAYLPTYYTSYLMWNNAANLSVAHFSGSAMTNINMLAGTNPGGAGFIGGSVLQGANKTAGVGDPLSSRLILLTTMTGTPVAYTYSNASGQFSFPNIAYGTYKLFGDAWGLQNPALEVTISAAQPSVSTITFEENSTSFTGSIGSLSTGDIPASLGGVRVFPNPATDHVQLIGLDAVAGEKMLTLAGMNGAVIAQQTVAQGAAASFSLASLPAGIYTLRVQTTDGVASFKVVK